MTNKTTALVICGLFAALTVICAFITLPLGFTPIPVNFALLAVFLAGGITGKKYGTVSIAIYILLGATGLPVFAGFKGGLGVLAGPTGGYIIGYAAAAFTVGFLMDLFYKKYINSAKIKYKGIMTFILLDLIMAAGLIICYFFGTCWFIISTGTNVGAALISCVLPFLPGDAVKIFIASLLIHKLRPMANNLLHIEVQS